ncbi:MAG: recombinase family protein [Bacilli bacterium]|nr:recombinase family protein [Bacilli bacterium]
MRRRVGIYARLSDEDRDKKNVTDESESIQNQKNMLIQYAISQGWEIYDIYCDEDYSGAGVYRPDYERILKDCENGKIDIVLCKTQSRFTRDLEDVEKYIHNKFLEWNIRFVSLIDNADTDNKGNKKSRQINGLINEWYLEDLSENIRGTLRAKNIRGELTSSFAPYGYLKNPDNKNALIIDPVSAEIVKKIFKLYSEGWGYYKIATYLNSQNILSPYEYKKSMGSNYYCHTTKNKSAWYTDTIGKMLKNPVYIGNLVQGKSRNLSYKNKKKIKNPKKDWIIVENVHEAIIDKDIWNIVSSKFAARKKPLKTGEVHYFSAKVYCAECSKVFTRNTNNRNGKFIEYLRCKGTHDGSTQCQNKFSIRVDLLEKVIIDQMNNKLDEYFNLEMLKEMNNNKTKADNEYIVKIQALGKEKESIEATIKKKNLYYKKLYEDRVDGLISDSEFKILTENFRNEISDLNCRVETINENLSYFSEKKKSLKDKKILFDKYKHIKILDRKIIEEFIEKIYIGKFNKETNERPIDIEWNFF